MEGRAWISQTESERDRYVSVQKNFRRRVGCPHNGKSKGGNTLEVSDFEQVHGDSYAKFLQGRLNLKLLKRKNISSSSLQQRH